MKRFSGTVEPLGRVEVSALVEWVSAIPFEDWPQQTPLGDGQLRPAMVNQPGWHGFYDVTAPVLKVVQAWLPRRTQPKQRLLSVVMSGHAIPPHVDKHSDRWYGRVHVPLTSDPMSRFVVGGEPHALKPGNAYLTNTLREHSVSNIEGTQPRIHLVVDWEW